MNKEIIEALKNNERPFGLMSEEMQAAAREIGKGKDFMVYQYSFGGFKKLTNRSAGAFIGDDTYRLRPDYEQEPEVEEVGLEMKYFILKPKAKSFYDRYAEASQAAMRAYAAVIAEENPTLNKELTAWTQKEMAAQIKLGQKD